MTSILDLSVTLTPPPAGADPEVLANITINYGASGLSHSGDVLRDPLSEQEREDLRWYLEEYWQWPYEQFLERGKRIERQLSTIGKRLYGAIFGTVEANRVLQAWRLQAGEARQVSIISAIPAVLSLPWELLHDEQGFLVLRTQQPVSLIRHLPQQELGALASTAFEPPLRILLVTARPVDAGFIDPRSTARPLFDEMQEPMEKGSIAIEVLRPPTLQALRDRLKDPTRPVHLLHFDGHGTFGGSPVQPNEQRKHDGEQGKLAFEDRENRLALVEASVLAQVLQDSGVRLVVLDACQSAVGSADDAFSSVAARLIQGGIDAVIAMSANVLVASSARYMGAFYRELAHGTAVPVALERARQALYDDPRRHLSRRQDEEGTPVELRDWWLPHYYQQRSLVFSETREVRKRKPKPAQATHARLNEQMPEEPRYGFSGRSRELLQVERWLGQNKLVVVHGFGGMGKTALAREAADWLTRTGMYQGACFVSFEGGRGSATSLLSQLGFFLGIYDGSYTPDDAKKALSQLQAALKQQRVLLIADNLESILAGGEAPLDAEERTELWDVLLELQRLGAGVLLTTRTTAFGDGRLSECLEHLHLNGRTGFNVAFRGTSRHSNEGAQSTEGTQVVYLRLSGLAGDDAYQLATSLLTSLRIDRRRSQYQSLRELLQQLGYHPLSIQLVLPALRSYSLAKIQEDFVALLPKFADDAETGRNRSLLASLEYSLQRLNEQQRGLLLRLVVFEGGAMESRLLAITEIAEAEWAALRQALEQAALLKVERLDGVNVPFLRFHPVLIPFLRGETKAQDEALKARYVQRYYEASNYYHDEDTRYPIQVRAIVQRELPNLRRALGWFLESGDLEPAVEMVDSIGQFLTVFGLHREKEQMQKLVAEVLSTRQSFAEGLLTRAEYVHEYGLGEEERRKGFLQSARARFQRLLIRIESEPEESPHGPGSYAHAVTLAQLGRCFEAGGDLSPAESLYRRAISISETLTLQSRENHNRLQLQSSLLADLGNVLLQQGHYVQAREVYEQGLQIDEHLGDVRRQAISREQLGAIALEQRKYAEARRRYQEAIATFQALGEPAMEAVAWLQLGRVAQEMQSWSEAEQYYRQSLILKEQLGDLAGAVQACSQLGQVAGTTMRFEEAKGWLQRALTLSGQIDATGGEYASHLFNMANLLVQEVEAERVNDTSAQLAEAQSYVEQATTINERLMSPDLWMNFHLLVRIANLQGRMETTHGYRRREREAYAAFAGHRSQIDQQFGVLLPVLVAAQDRLEVRAQIAGVLSQLEAKGWHISQALQRIWTGERDWHTLSEGLDDQDALLVLRVLESLDQPEGISEQIGAAFPSAIRDAIEQKDQEELVRQLLKVSLPLSKSRSFPLFSWL